MADNRRTLHRRDGSKKNGQTKEFIQRLDDPTGFWVEKFENKGRGVVTEIRKNGDFLLVNRGENVSANAGDKRGEEKSSGYRFFFHSGGKRLCIDATEENKTLGRLVNHGEKLGKNCLMKECFGNLCLFAMRYRDSELSSDDSGDEGDSDDETEQNHDNYTNYTFPGPSSEVKKASSSRIKTAQKIELTDEHLQLLSRWFKRQM